MKHIYGHKCVLFIHVYLTTPSLAARAIQRRKVSTVHIQLDETWKEAAVDQSEELSGVCQQNHKKSTGITSTQAGISTQNLVNTK